MPTPADFLSKLSEIVGHDVSDSRAKLHLSWNNREEGRAVLQRIRTMQKQLRFLKQEVNAIAAAVKSDYTTERMKVGKTLASGLAAGFFGRRTVGRFNSAQRDSLRRSQMGAVAPYEAIKHAIDRTIASLDQVKGRVELSPEYQQTASSPSTSRLVDSAARFYAYLREEVKGPYSRDQLAALFDTQVISTNTMCCPEGSEEWQAYDIIRA